MKNRVYILIQILILIALLCGCNKTRGFIPPSITKTAAPTSKPTPKPTVEPTTEPQQEQDSYILNMNTKRIHMHTCTYVDYMYEGNKSETTIPKERLLALGYDACDYCIP